MLSNKLSSSCSEIMTDTTECLTRRLSNYSFSLFTDEQQSALEDDPTQAVSLSHQFVHQHTSPCANHHTQLIGALQLGESSEEGRETHKNVFLDQLNHTCTSSGRHTLWKWLEHPLTNARDILLRRKMRETLVSQNDETRSHLKKTLACMEDEWNALCWCWDESKSKTELVENLLFTGYMAPINDVPAVVNTYHFMRVCGTPLIHCLAPIVPVLLSFGMLKWMGSGMNFHECWDMSTGVFKNALWFDGGASNNAFSSLLQQGGGSQKHPLLQSIGHVVPKVIQSLKWLWWAVFLVNIIMMVYQCYRHYKLLSHVYHRTRQACLWIQHAMSMSPQYATLDATNPVHKQLSQLVEWTQQSTPHYTLFTNVSDFLQAYMTLRSSAVRGECERLLRQVGVMDALQSIDVLLSKEGFCVPDVFVAEEVDVEEETIVEHTDTTKSKTSSEKNEDEDDNQQEQETTTQQNNGPHLHMTDAYHPILPESQTKHTLSLDKHVVLTGSNASGKSTVLKTMLLNVLLAQSWGVVCASSMCWTPFAVLRGYLHTTDDCGKESLFQAQIRRIEDFIQHAKDNPNEKALLVVDEILNSTNPIEAMLLSYQYAKTIGSDLSDTTRMVMTTHYPVLTTLADNHTEFMNWAMQQQYTIGIHKKCKASSAIGTVRKMTHVLGEKEHQSLEKAYKRMYKKLEKMKFKELDA